MRPGWMLALVPVVLAALASASPAWGRTAEPVGGPPPIPGLHAESTLTLTAAPLEAGEWALKATARSPKGAIGSLAVRFTLFTEFLGTRPVPLGSAATDAAGAARVTYRPTWIGMHRIVARASLDDGVVASNEILIQVSEGRSPLEGPAARLPVISGWAGPIAASVIAAIWGTLALVLIRVLVGIHRAAAVAAGRPDDPVAGSRNRRWGHDGP